MMLLGVTIGGTAGTALSAGDSHVAPVEVAVARLEKSVEIVELTGSVTADQQASLSARTVGLVEKVAVDAGSEVKRGDHLLVLDRSLARLAVKKAETNVLTAETRLAEAQRLVDEVKTLVKRGGFPASDAKARQSVIEVREAELAGLEIAAAEQAEILDRHVLVAPFDGVIVRKLTEVGEWVETGDPVLELVGTKKVWFDVRAPQELAPVLTDDTEVVVTLDLRGAEPLQARVVARVPFKDSVSRTFLVRLQVENPDAEMLPGTSGMARFLIAGDAPVVTVPRDALVRQPDGSTAVWVVSGEGAGTVAKQRRVETGHKLQASVVIETGLSEGETVVIKGNEALRNGQAVKLPTPGKS
ncbi:MAG: efflux RND transporter periplasmic adaptor subunit [Verrucomicrobiales bacterium]